jgi:DNA-directed RNA polymerase alpha subunit
MNKNMTVMEYFTIVCPNQRICNALYRGGVITMEEVCGMPEEELLRVRNFGVTSLAIVLEERQKYLARRDGTLAAAIPDRGSQGRSV